MASMPSQFMAARPAASTPAERGWMSCNEATSTSAKTGSDADLAGEAVGPQETAGGAGSDAAETGPATMRRAA